MYSTGLGEVIQPTPNMNIALMVVGTRGDLEPFIEIGKRLQQDGHRVRICSHAVYNSTVINNGLEFYPISGDPKKLSEFMVKTRGTIVPTSDTLKAVLTSEAKQMSKMLREIVFSIWPAVSDPDQFTGVEFLADAIIANPPVTAHIHVAEKLRIPVHIVFPQPWYQTSHIAHPLSGSIYSDYGKKNAMNSFSYDVVDEILSIGTGGMIMELRHDLKLPQISHTAVRRLIKQIPHTFLFSRYLIPKPQDWPDQVNVVGAVQGPEMDAFPGPEELKNFLEAGDAPIYVGFGSTFLPNPSALRDKFIQAANQSGVRILIQNGWTDLYDESLEKCSPFSIYCFIGSAPHSWLFKHVSAVVHHGGAGTTSAGLYAGKPTMVVPFVGDQYLWGMAVYSKGAGPYPHPLQKLTTKTITKSFILLTSKKMQTAALKLSRQMKSENAIEDVVHMFYEFLAPVVPRVNVSKIE